MQPAKGQTVVLYLRYGFQIEGVVSEWDENQIVLTSSGSHLIIYNPKEDLILAKIMGKSRLSNVINQSNTITKQAVSNPNPVEDTMDVVEPLDSVLVDDYNVVPPEVLQEEFDATVKAPSSDLRLKKLAQLKSMLNQADKEITANKLKTPTIKGSPVQYANTVSMFKRNI
jgi:hypothetical protein